MAIAAKISSTELTAQVTDRFVDQFFEARLIYAPGTTYQPGVTNDATFLGFEVAIGTGGYRRQLVGYSSGDVSSYSDDGVGLTTKATIFAQDGTATGINFSHAALVWSSGNILTLNAPSTVPTAGIDGTYTNIPITTTNLAGTDLAVDLTITNSGATAGDYALSISSRGYGYVAGEVLSIPAGVLAGLGAIATESAGAIGFDVASVSTSSNGGNLLAVGQTSGSALITAGNEAIFYWNLKQFGFYNV